MTDHTHLPVVIKACKHLVQNAHAHGTSAKMIMASCKGVLSPQYAMMFAGGMGTMLLIDIILKSH